MLINSWLIVGKLGKVCGTASAQATLYISVCVMTNIGVRQLHIYDIYWRANIVCVCLGELYDCGLPLALCQTEGLVRS